MPEEKGSGRRTRKNSSESPDRQKAPSPRGVVAQGEQNESRSSSGRTSSQSSSKTSRGSDHRRSPESSSDLKSREYRDRQS